MWTGCGPRSLSFVFSTFPNVGLNQIKQMTYLGDSPTLQLPQILLSPFRGRSQSDTTKQKQII